MNQKALLTTALGALLSFGANSVAAADAPASEKCYGVVKAGKNDCQTASNACSGQVKTDGRGDAWVYLPKGTCEKIVGGSLTAKK